jgi:EpsI family protein
MKLSAHYLVGLGLLLSATVLFRQYPGEELVPVKPDFSGFPLQIDGWQGRDVRLDQEIMDVLKADDLMMRHYQSAYTKGVWLFVGYYKSQRTGATYHSPLNCLPGGGWTIVQREEVPLSLQERTVPVNKVLLQKGLDKQVILYWYQDRGRIITSEYWAKGYLVWDAMARNRTDGALVRVSMPVTQSTEQALSVGMEFLHKAVPLLNRYLPG